MITNPGAAPVDHVLASSSQTASTVQWRNDDNGIRSIGQSFYANKTFDLDAFSIRLASAPGAAFPGSSCTVSIYTLLKPDESISGKEPTFIQWGTLPTTISGSGSYLQFDLDEVRLTGGYYYLLVVALDSYASGRNQQLSLGSPNPSDTYKLGKSFTLTNGSAFYMTADFAFTIQEAPQPVTVLSALPTMS